MTSNQEPQTHSKPVSVAQLLADHPDWRFLGDDTSLEICGVSVSNGDMQPGWAFVGIPGLARHGAQFADPTTGAALLVTDEEGALIAPTMPTLVVPDPRCSAAEIANALYGEHIDPLVTVGVTGTNGKTTTTYFIRACLASSLAPTALLGTIEIDTPARHRFAERTTSESPVVYRVLAESAQSGAKSGVVEVSSHALSLQRVRGIRFDCAVFTNLQHDHLDYYGDMDNYFEAKAALFTPESTKQAVVAVDDHYGRELAKRSAVPTQAVQVLTDDLVELAGVPLWKVTEIALDPASGGTRFTLVEPGGQTHLATCPLPGNANVQDAALALVCANALGVALEDAIQSLALSAMVPGRMHWIAKPGGSTPAAIVDYAHTPEAAELMLQTLRPFTSGRVHVVFGTDGDRDATKREPLAEVYASGADVLWVTDENPRTEDAESVRAQLLAGIRRVRPGMEDVTEVHTSRRDAIRMALQAADRDDLVIVAGKGAERCQEWNGVRHHFYDPDVVAEVLRDAPTWQ